MKKILTILILILSFNTLNSFALSLSAQSSVLIEAESGKVLFQHNSTLPKTMASTTKIMTGLLAVESGKFDDVVTVSQKAASQEGTSMYLKAGEKVSFSELIYGLLLSSGNDAAVAIAEHLCGSVEEFAAKMTNRAKTAGAYQTTFKNPNGLDEDGHCTTALDMAKITAHAMKNEKFAEIVSTNSITLSKGTYTNHNKLLKMYDGVCGVKTGYTKKSGRCLVSACRKNGVMLIAVTLNAPDDWNDHMKMYDFGFSNYNLITPVTKNDIFGTVKAENGQSVELIYDKNISLYLSAEEQKRLEILNDTPVSISLPVKKGQKIGTVSAYLDGKKLDMCNLVSKDEIMEPPEEKGFFEILYNTAKSWLSLYL